MRSSVERVRLTKTHLVSEDATHALGTYFVHPCHTFELVVAHGAANQAIRLLGHREVVVSEGLTVERCANPTQNLGLLSEDVRESLALFEKIVELLRLTFFLFFRNGSALPFEGGLAFLLDIKVALTSLDFFSDKTLIEDVAIFHGRR